MFVIVDQYILVGFLLTLGFAGWAAWVAADKYRNLDRALRREIIIGLVIIALIAGPVAVIAAYLSKPATDRPGPPHPTPAPQ
jgi:hypothetical protein